MSSLPNKDTKKGSSHSETSSAKGDTGSKTSSDTRKKTESRSTSGSSSRNR